MESLRTFRELVNQYLRKARKLQKNLAEQVGLSASELNRRLNGKGKVSLQSQDIKLIVKALAKWKGLESRQEAQELLTLMEVRILPAWNGTPLRLLHLMTGQQPPVSKLFPLKARTGVV